MSEILKQLPGESVEVPSKVQYQKSHWSPTNPHSCVSLGTSMWLPGLKPAEGSQISVALHGTNNLPLLPVQAVKRSR